MRVVVVGAGFAGLTAAVALQERRHQVTLIERRGVLGGRATSYRDSETGEDVDNGTHLMVGAYHATQDLLRRAGAEGLLLAQDNLRLDYVDDRGITSLDCPPLPAPLHLLAGMLGLRVPWRVRGQAVRLGLAMRFGRPPRGITLAEYLARTGQGVAARRLLWDPLATAILNETPERVAAILFYDAYREAFLADHRASRLIFLRCGWGTLCERIGAYFGGRGGTLQRSTPALSVEIAGGRAIGVRARIDGAERLLRAEAVVLAVPWRAVPELLPEAQRAEPPFRGLAGLGGSPIVSVEMWLDRVVVDRPMLGLRDSEMDWVFDKGRLYGRPGPPQHLSFVVSAARRDLSRPRDELAASAEASLRRYFPKAMADARVLRVLVMREPDATFSGGPESEALRPGPVTPVDGLFLAGDWTATGLPATIEGAVRSGHAAARAADGQSLRPGRI